MKGHTVFLTLFILLGFFGCKSHKPVTTVLKYVKLGEGGGFTGAWEYWSVNQNGKVFYIGTEGKSVEKQSVDIKAIKQIFAEVDAFFKSQKEVVNRPGNMSRTLNFVDGASERQATWAVEDPQYVQLDSMYISWLSRIKGK